MLKTSYTLVRLVDDTFYLLNLLYGTIDKVNSEVAAALKSSSLKGLPQSMLDQLRRRRYISSEKDSQWSQMRSLYGQYSKCARKAPCLLYVPLSLECNLACEYCFQRSMDKEKGIPISVRMKRITAAIASFAKNDRFGKGEGGLRVVLYGGEPLLAKNHKYVEDLLRMCMDYGLTSDIVTNGTTISEFLPTLSRFSSHISSVIVTVDGDEETHNKLRHTNSGEGTFTKIMEGLRALKRKTSTMWLESM